MKEVRVVCSAVFPAEIVMREKAVQRHGGVPMRGKNIHRGSSEDGQLGSAVVPIGGQRNTKL